MTERCMIRVKDKKELDGIQKEFPLVIKAFLTDDCDPCGSLKESLERECKDTDALMPFKVVPTLHCPVEEKFCRDELEQWYVNEYKAINGTSSKAARKQLKKIGIGVPVVIGQTPDGVHFAVVGDDKKSLGDAYSSIRSMIERTRKKWVGEDGK